MKKIIHDSIILTVLTLVLGFLLGMVYDITKKPIEDAEYAASQEAYSEVFKEASKFDPMEDFDAEKANAFVSGRGYKDSIDDVELAYDSSKNVIGYVITVTAKDASQDVITFSVGIKNDGTVNGYSITAIAETPGLGMKAADESFSSQFEGKAVSSFSVVKQAASSDEEIEAISGATITSKAVANGVNAAKAYFEEFLTGGE